MIDNTTVYFTAQTSNAPGGFVIDFRHVSTGLVLSIAEGMQLEGLPEQMKMHRHPGLPGKAAWIFPATILQIGMALRRAGFGSSPEEVANPRVMPPKPTPQQAQSNIVQLAPGIVMDMSGMMPREGGGKIEEPEDFVFGMFETMIDGKPGVYVKFADRDEEGYCETYSCREVPDLSAWEDIKDIVTPSKDWSERFVSSFGAEETKALLEQKNVTFIEKMFFCHPPEDLDFGVSEDKDSFLGAPCYTIFVIPRDDRAPFFDDLRDEHLVEVPPYFSDNISENTWELQPDADRDVVIADMIARGYTHKPELDGELGG